MSFFMKTVALGLLFAVGAVTAAAQEDYFRNWPAGSSPQEVGKPLTEHFISSLHQFNTVFYCEVGTWYGALTFAQLSGDTDLRDRLISKQGI